MLDALAPRPYGRAVFYSSLLHFHNLVRWIVLVAGAIAAARAWRGGPSGRAGLAFTIALDTQVLVGIVMYVAVSPIVQTGLGNMRGAMKDHVLRFWVVEHPIAMLVGLVLAHAARIVERRGIGNAGKQRRAAILFTVAVIILILGVPWPFLPYGRPLFPGM